MTTNDQIKRHVALVNRATLGIVNRLEYYPLVQGDYERKVNTLVDYRNDWYQNTSFFTDTILDIMEIK